MAPGPLRRLPELAAVTSLVSHKPDFAAVTRGPGPATSLRVVRELEDWVRLTPEALQGWRDRLILKPADERGEIVN